MCLIEKFLTCINPVYYDDSGKIILCKEGRLYRVISEDKDYYCIKTEIPNARYLVYKNDKNFKLEDI